MVNRNISIISKFFHTGVSPGPNHYFASNLFLISFPPKQESKKEKNSIEERLSKTDAY